MTVITYCMFDLFNVWHLRLQERAKGNLRKVKTENLEER